VRLEATVKRKGKHLQSTDGNESTRKQVVSLTPSPAYEKPRTREA